jgi:hypothetical protein
MSDNWILIMIFAVMFNGFIAGWAVGRYQGYMTAKEIYNKDEYPIKNS